MPRLVLAVRDDDKELVDACLVCLARVDADTEYLISKFFKGRRFTNSSSFTGLKSWEMLSPLEL